MAKKVEEEIEDLISGCLCRNKEVFKGYFEGSTSLKEKFGNGINNYVNAVALISINLVLDYGVQKEDIESLVSKYPEDLEKDEKDIWQAIFKFWHEICSPDSSKTVSKDTINKLSGLFKNDPYLHCKAHLSAVYAKYYKRGIIENKIELNEYLNKVINAFCEAYEGLEKITRYTQKNHNKITTHTVVDLAFLENLAEGKPDEEEVKWWGVEEYLGRFYLIYRK